MSVTLYVWLCVDGCRWVLARVDRDSTVVLLKWFFFFFWSFSSECDCCTILGWYRRFRNLRRRDQREEYFYGRVIYVFWFMWQAAIGREILFVWLWISWGSTYWWFWWLVFFCFRDFRFHSIWQILPCLETSSWRIFWWRCWRSCYFSLIWFPVRSISYFVCFTCDGWFYSK